MDEPGFTGWVAGRQRQLLRSACLLTGDLHRAEDLVQEALTKVALRIIARDNITWWRRRRDVPTDVVDGGSVGEEPEIPLVVRRALARWWRLPYPEGFVRREYHLPEVLPLDAGRLWLGRGNRSWFVDVDRARVEEHRVSLQSTVWGGGDTYVATSDAFNPPMDALSVGPLGAPLRSFRTNGLGTLSDVVADTRSLAAVRGACVGSGPQRRGLMALDLDDLSTRGYLGIRDPTLTFTCGSALETLAWVDADTVLGSVATLLPANGLGRRTLFTWNVETGDLRRVGAVPGNGVFDVASLLLFDWPVGVVE